VILFRKKQLRIKSFRVELAPRIKNGKVTVHPARREMAASRFIRAVAQLGRARRSGRRGPGFKSLQPDYLCWILSKPLKTSRNPRAIRVCRQFPFQIRFRSHLVAISSLDQLRTLPRQQTSHLIKFPLPMERGYAQRHRKKCKSTILLSNQRRKVSWRFSSRSYSTPCGMT
jgi:hypothetical protein